MVRRIVDRRSAALWTFALVSAAGCGSVPTHTGWSHGARPASLGRHAIPGVDGGIPDQWRRVFVGNLPRPRLAGYVKSRHVDIDGSDALVHWVYDEEFRLVGVMSDNGRTTRFDRAGRTAYVGMLKTDDGLLALYGYETLEGNTVRFVPMPAPAE